MGIQKRLWIGPFESKSLLERVAAEYEIATVEDKILCVAPGTTLELCCGKIGDAFRPMVHVRGGNHEADFLVVVGRLPIDDSARDLAIKNNLPYPDLNVANDYFDLQKRLEERRKHADAFNRDSVFF